ncbi:rpsU-divergently transcribed protein [Polytolypa hystricis UAMH7299]|uniref:Ubiquinone biosynthesis protein n=1 Tax=Polytolypa hystricis (strain UAMH7299) TaxID=1447883 RepID=A0A2B7Z0F8_POLH7|nr:rpsU-divergently transcribed protein [Polytolypa hystricis UAMH7299]
MSHPFSLLRRPVASSSLVKLTTRSRTITTSSLTFSHLSRTPSCRTFPNQSISRLRPCSVSKSQPTRSIRPTSRTYHSAFDPALPDPATKFSSEQCAILSAAINHIPEHGFSTKALTLGVRDAGYLDVSLQLFPEGGELALVMYWFMSRRQLLWEKAESGELFGENQLSVAEKVKLLIWERLKMNESVIHQFQDALAIISVSLTKGTPLLELDALAGDILYLAGDRSNDISWYSKRLSIAAIYASSEVVMTEDTSPDFASTKEFMERRINDANVVRECFDGLSPVPGALFKDLTGIGRSWGLKI